MLGILEMDGTMLTCDTFVELGIVTSKLLVLIYEKVFV